MKIAIVGATGAVGRMMCAVCEEYELPVDEIVLFASQRSAGQTVSLFGKPHQVQLLTPEVFKETHFDIALFSAGGSVSEVYAPLAAKEGTVVIDNSSVFRRDQDKALVVPEINLDAIDFTKSLIIANPNCSTIQSVIPLAPLSDAFGITRIDYATYQSVSGAGQKGMADLLNGEKGEAPKTFPYPIVHNVIPQIDQPMDNDYTKEEMKMIWETQKILNLPDCPISATCVRVPVLNAHSVDVRVVLKKEAFTSEIKMLLEKTPGVILKDDLQHFIYPMPYQADGHDEVYVGRIRQDLYDPKCFHFFCCGDNLRKGAASNAVQIAQALITQHLLP